MTLAVFFAFTLICSAASAAQTQVTFYDANGSLCFHQPPR